MGQMGLDDNLEEMLMGGSFYSSASTDSHLTRLRESVQIRNSLSSQSISRATGGLEKTSFMKNSPSIKALESILNEKSNTGAYGGAGGAGGVGMGDMDVVGSIQEEDEDLEDTDETLFSKPGGGSRIQSNNPFRHSMLGAPAAGVGRLELLHRDEANSVQTFETANSYKSTGSRTASVATVDENGYSTSENTPVNHPPTYLPGKDGHFHDASHLNVSHKVNKNGQHSFTRVPSEQEDTLIDEREDHFDKYGSVGASSKDTEFRNEPQPQHKTKSMIPDDIEFKKPVMMAALNEQTTSKNRSSGVSLNTIATPKQGSMSTFTTPQHYKSPIAATPSSASPRKSPHLRSNSAFSLSFGKNKEANASPGTHKRSSTLSDLSKISNSGQGTKEKKKFSFKSLFKSKSKSNLANGIADSDVSLPQKVKDKSYSTPNLHQASRVENEEEFGIPQTQRFIAENKSDSTQKGNRKKKEKENERQKQKLDDPSGFTMSPSTSLLNVFRKNKNTPPPGRPIDNDEISIKDGLGIYKAQNLEDGDTNGSKAYKSNTNINFIREVTDDDNYPQTHSSIGLVESTSHQGDLNLNEDDYDSKNLLNNPPIKLSNARYDEEMSLIPERPVSVSLGNDNIFGSPFKVDYKSAQNTPRLISEEHSPTVPGSSKVLRDMLEPNKSAKKEERASHRSSKSKDQLAGETFFPRSLSPHEVESIVSLDRSRSMRSVRSNKRSSFANYDGSDENIIHYQGEGLNPSNSTSVSRSGSILKNSSSKKSLKIDDYPETTNGTEVTNGAEVINMVDETEDPNYSALFEFTDFIDFDNLDFSTSPVPSKEMSPIATKEMSPVYSKNLSPDASHSATHSVITVPDESDIFDSSVIMTTPPPSKSIDAQSKEKELPSINVPLTPNLEVISPTKIASPGSLTSHESEISAVLGHSFEGPNSPELNENGKTVTNNRPISMSFRGLKGPAFGSQLEARDLRTSDSHQSFNISFGDEDTDYSGTEVGGGFGSSDGEDSLSDSPNKENMYQYGDYTNGTTRKQFGSTNHSNTFSPPRLFNHNKIPSISDSNNSSPASLNSVVSRLKKSPQVRQSPRLTKVPKVGVQFSSRIILYDTYNGDEYDRHPDTATCNQITPMMAQQIREEMNMVKSQMEVHEDSRCYTHFF